MRLCALKRLQASCSTEPRVLGEGGSTEKVGCGDPHFALELHLEELEPCFFGTGGEEAVILDMKLAGLGWGESSFCDDHTMDN